MKLLTDDAINDLHIAESLCNSLPEVIVLRYRNAYRNRSIDRPLSYGSIDQGFNVPDVHTQVIEIVAPLPDVRSTSAFQVHSPFYKIKNLFRFIRRWLRSYVYNRYW